MSSPTPTGLNLQSQPIIDQNSNNNDHDYPEDEPDTLTLLQTRYDQLLTQIFSTVSYLSQRHPIIPPDPDPTEPYTRHPPPQSATAQTPNGNTTNSLPLLPPPPPPHPPSSLPTAPDTTAAATTTEHPRQSRPQTRVIYHPGPEDTSPSRTAYPLRPDTPTTFSNSQSELAHDLILKARQIHALIEDLADDVSGEVERKREEQIRGLSERVREVERERAEVRGRAGRLARRVDGVVLGMRGSVG